MSWTLAIPSSPAADFDATVAKAKQTYIDNKQAADVEPDAGALAQMDEAAKAASALLASGIIGDGTVTGMLAGHANPGHKPEPGWANDSITVTLSCAYVQPTA